MGALLPHRRVLLNLIPIHGIHLIAFYITRWHFRFIIRLLLGYREIEWNWNDLITCMKGEYEDDECKYMYTENLRTKR